MFLVLFLDNQHRVIRHEEMFAGTIGHVEVYPREIVRGAMKVNAAALILAHNHPSGRAEPSLMDRKYIRTMAAKKFGMELPIKLKNLIR